jgi:hypothetical protein
MSDSRARLAQLLGASAPDLDRLSEEEASQMLCLVEEEASHNDRAIVEGVDEALSGFPLLVRVPARMILLG